MNIETYDKPIITRFVKLDDHEFNLRKLLGCLCELSDADEPLKDYEMSSDLDVADKLVEMGLLNNYIGSRMAHFYSIKDKRKVEELIEKLEKLF